MKHHIMMFALLTGAATWFAVAAAQQPAVNIDPQRHGNLAAAQDSIVQAYARVTEAQRDNRGHLSGHAEKAKELLNQANDELRLAADTIDEGGAGTEGPPPNAPQVPPSLGTEAAAPPTQLAPSTQAAPQPPTDLSGKWTIYAYNADQPGSSLKSVQLTQNGNILSGTFHGPHQHGKLQGWVNGNHVEFSTDTRDVLTFRGDITPTGMSGLYGVHGRHAPWNAERSQ